MSRTTTALIASCLATSALLFSTAANAVPIGYRIEGIRGEFLFTGPGGADSYFHEFETIDEIVEVDADGNPLVDGDGNPLQIDDTFSDEFTTNDYRFILGGGSDPDVVGDAAAENMSSEFAGSSVIIDWFEDAGAEFGYQDFFFRINNYRSPTLLGTTTYTNLSFALDLDVVFFGQDDDGYFTSESIFVEDFLIDLTGALVPGGYFAASYTISPLTNALLGDYSDVDGDGEIEFEEGGQIDPINWLVQSELGEGFLLTANVPATIFNPIGGGPGGGGPGVTVPEPPTYALLAAGLFGLGLASRRRRRGSEATR